MLLQTWSLVALIYNNWIFYIPTADEIEAGFEMEPAMCTTTRNIGGCIALDLRVILLIAVERCKKRDRWSEDCEQVDTWQIDCKPWWSCMEWCLSGTAPPDECIHLYATVRSNGTNIRSGAAV